jgi:hypothetical protein
MLSHIIYVMPLRSLSAARPLSPWLNDAIRFVVTGDDELLRNPITAIDCCCCAPAARGHAAAPPTNVMNSRRLMLDMGTSSPAGSASGTGPADDDDRFIAC